MQKKNIRSRALTCVWANAEEVSGAEGVAAGVGVFAVVSDARTGSLLLRLNDATGPVWALALAVDHIWSASADRHIRCYHAQVQLSPIF